MESFSNWPTWLQILVILLPVTLWIPIYFIIQFFKDCFSSRRGQEQAGK